MRPSVLVTGSASFLAAGFIGAARDTLNLTTLRRPQPGAVSAGRYDAVVNFAIHPAYMTAPYRMEVDVDRALGEEAARAGAHYFMLSTRMVYGPGDGSVLSETRSPAPHTTYARNKAATEAALSERLASNVTILRLGNVFDMELGRRTFAGQALSTLHRDNRIVLDISPVTERDFLPRQVFSAILVKLIEARPGGVVNVGSGIPTKVGDMAKWFVEGFRSGEVVSTSDEVRDAFCLDTGRLSGLVGEVTDANEISECAMDTGRRLRLA